MIATNFPPTCARSRQRLAGLACALLPCLLPAAGAETDFSELSLEDLGQIKVPTVVGASKHEQKITEAPSSVTIITRDEIRKGGNRTLAEVLNGVPGLYVRNDRNFSLLGIRGFSHPGSYNEKFQVLVDGHRINDGVTSRVGIGNDFAIDVDLIERVEVIRGPGSSLYGNNAFFGVINVITRRGHDIDGTEVSASGGTLGSAQGRFTFGKRLANEVELALSGGYQHSDGNARLFYPEFNDPSTNDGIARHRDLEKSGNAFASISWRDLTFEGSYVERTKVIPTAPYGTVFNDPRNRTKETRAALDLKYEHTTESELNLLARVAYDRGTTDGTYVYDGGLPDPVLNLDEFLSQRLTVDWQMRRTFFENNTVTAGAQWVRHLSQAQANYDVEPAMTYLDDRRSGSDYAVYLQDEYQILQNLIFNGGFRYDHFYSFGGTVNPRLALIYSPVETTTLKLLYGTAFRAPSPNELYYSDGGISQVPSPNLRPETIATYELVLEQRLGQHLSASASGFYYNIDNLIREATLPPGDPNAGAILLENLGSAKAKGLELSLRGTWAHGFEGRISYSLTDARDGMTDARLVNSPVHLAKLSFTAPLYREKIFATLDCHYASGRETLAGQTAKGFGTFNFTLFSQELVKGMELSASIYNLFNTRFSEPGGPEHLQDLIPQDGRTFRVKLAYRF